MDSGDNRFLQKWTRIRKRGAALYLLKWVVLKTLILIGLLFVLLYFYPDIKNMPVLSTYFQALPDLGEELAEKIRLYGAAGLFVLALATSIIRWRKNQDRYDILSRFHEA